MIKLGVIGAGAWGTAVAKAVAEKGFEVDLWCLEEQVETSINQRHENEMYLPGIKLPESLHASVDIVSVASDVEFLILATPSLFVIPTVQKILSVPNIMNGISTIGIITKGFIPGRDRPGLIVEHLENYLPGFYKDNVVYISGPSHAEEVAMGKITGLISASNNPKNSIKIRELLTSDSLKVFSSLDIVGVQVSAALKNVVAIAFGMMDSLKDRMDILGDNTESLLLAAGLNEIQQIGRAMGATHPETFTSIAGVGDLDVTCRSIYGRNRRFGQDIIRKSILEGFTNIDDLIDRIQQVGYLPEGAVACKFAHQLAVQYKLKTPIIDMVYRSLNKESSPEEMIAELVHQKL